MPAAPRRPPIETVPDLKKNMVKSFLRPEKPLRRQDYWKLAIRENEPE
jgi:hypothetical protein